MKIIRLTLLLLAMFTITSAGAKTVKQPNVYIFGISASFSDSTVYITDVQTLDSAWIETKGKYLLVQDEYSNQLRSYFTNALKNPHRTCVIFYATKPKDIEKKMAKIKKIYTSKNNFDVKYLTSADFKFKKVEIAL